MRNHTDLQHPGEPGVEGSGGADRFGRPSEAVVVLGVGHDTATVVVDADEVDRCRRDAQIVIGDLREGLSPPLHHLLGYFPSMIGSRNRALKWLPTLSAAAISALPA